MTTYITVSACSLCASCHATTSLHLPWFTTAKALLASSSMDDDVVFVGASDPSARRSAAPRKRKAPSNLVDLSHFTDAEPLPARAAGAASTSASAAAGLAAAARAAGTALPGAVAQGLAAAQEQALDSDAEEWEPQQGRKKKPKVQKAAAAKKPKAPKAPKEKRGARFSARPSQQIQQRIARALPGESTAKQECCWLCCSTCS